jgi:hypothetical protein
MFSPAVDAHWELPPPETAPALASLDTPAAEASLVGTTTASNWQPPRETDAASWLGSAALLCFALALLLAALSLAHRRSQPPALLRS